MCSNENMEDGIDSTPNDRKIETVIERDTNKEKRNAIPENVESENSTSRPHITNEFLLWRTYIYLRVRATM